MMGYAIMASEYKNGDQCFLFLRTWIINNISLVLFFLSDVLNHAQKDVSTQTSSRDVL